ncbi:class I SAM-dependent methyltransferase [Streptomyces ipomoeae]|uniref:class I SAM-dependent methyltransferase n=1 Tax=Streptomyces ipomoeae TaxID=103232 RepID=UPI00114628E0|nr:class I SAM-dependent methyltransferase [Streptomyces ipomoeae]MDX2937007.1 class I SAM-dependent methyltransferase [Streptomyces ipomoeae]TQE26165.1 class I SAM-dependent methyltransferase [Streptomyces ipomoeae]
MAHHSAYLLGHSESEHQRLSLQSKAVSPFTERTLRSAGVRPGMNVLDIGAGLGDVSLLAAGLVGPGGHVVGIDRAPGSVHKARIRSRDAGLARSVRYEVADVGSFTWPEKFDVLVGRYILMYLPDPASTLRRLASLLKPDGIVVMHEMDFTNTSPSHPPLPEWDQYYALWPKPFLATGAVPDFGPRLTRTFLDAGLQRPEVATWVPVAGSGNSAVLDWLSTTCREIESPLRTAGVTVPDHLRFDDSLPQRLRDLVLSRGAQVSGPTQFGAHVRLASQVSSTSSHDGWSR